jgi:hypothetical protein
VRACTLENEAEAEIVCSILEEQDISYTLKKMEDAAYDGLYVSQGPWGFIETPVAYVDSVVQILKDVRESKTDGDTPRSTSPTNGKAKVLRFVEIGVPIVLFLGIVVVLISYINLKQTYSRYVGRQAVNWTWMPAEKAMVGRLRANGQVRYKDYDRNYNNIYEESNIYSIDGKRVTTYYDQDENHSNEHYTVKSVNGDLISEGWDRNENGVYEDVTEYYSNTEYVEYLNNDEDGLADKAIIHKDGKIRTVNLRELLFSGQP